MGAIKTLLYERINSDVVPDGNSNKLFLYSYLYKVYGMPLLRSGVRVGHCPFCQRRKKVGKTDEARTRYESKYQTVEIPTHVNTLMRV